MMEGPCADSEEKHEPVSDTDTAAMESLKALDPDRPIREADIALVRGNFGPKVDLSRVSFYHDRPRAKRTQMHPLT